MVPVLPSHDSDGEEEGGEGPVKVGPAEGDVFPRAKVVEYDVSDEGVGEDDEEEDAHERRGADESADNSDGQVLHYTLVGNEGTAVWKYGSMGV